MNPNTVLNIHKLMQQITTTDNLLDMLYDCVDRVAIPFALKKHNSNQTKAAKYLGISRTTLQKKILKLGINL